MSVGKQICPNCFEVAYEDGFCPKCGYREEYEDRGEAALPAGVVLNERYIIGKVLGAGGFGITYKACDIISGRICAIKEYFPSGLVRRLEDRASIGLIASENETRYQEGLEQFIEEAQILSKLGQISSVVGIFECFKTNKTACFSMELLDGATLKQIIRTSRNRLPVEEIVDIVLQVAMTMDIIHKKANILHLDISPDNIYITKDKKVKLIDFGSARQNVSPKENSVLIQVKLKYAPPEQYSGNMRLGTYSDVYALASTCYYALTGQFLPTAAERLKGKSYVPLKQLNIPVSEEFSDALDCALELKYQERTATMQTFIAGITKKKAVYVPPKVPGKKKVAYMQLYTNGKAVQYWVLPYRTEITVGRALGENSIVISGYPDISKIHCILMFDEIQDSFFVKDVSRNGIYVKGTRLKKDVTYKIGASGSLSLASERCIIKVGIKYEYN